LEGGWISLRAPLASLAATAMLSAGCVSNTHGAAAHRPLPTPAAAASPALRGPVDDALGRRASAVLRGDEAGFLADIDPAQGGLVERERVAFRNLRQLPVAELDYRRFSPHGPMLLPPDAPITVVAVMVFRLAGVDAGSSSIRYRYTFLRTGARVLITGIEPAGAPVAYMIWDEAPLTVFQAGSVQAGSVLLAADETAPGASGLAGQAASAAAQVRELWGSRPAPPGFLVFLTADDQRFRRWAGGPGSEVQGIEFPVPGVDVADGQASRYVGSRVVVDLSRVDQGSVGVLLRHELAHAVSALVRDRLAPTWAEEGFANWVEGEGAPYFQRGQAAIVAREVAGGRFSGQLVADGSFYTSAELNYATAYTVFRFVAERWGAQTAVDLFVRAIGPYPLEMATSSALNLSEDAFLEQWQAYARQLQP
jgi:hypothetical protein